MVSLLKRLVFFGIFSLIFYLLIMPLWASYLPFYMAKNVRSCIGCYGHSLTRMREAKEVSDIDVLIIGSSHAYRGIDPRIFEKKGLKTFNLGSSAQSPINTKMLLKQHLDIINPKFIIYEVYVGTLGIDGISSSLDLLSNTKIDVNSMFMALEINNYAVYNTLIFSFFRQLYGIDLNDSEDINQNGDLYISNKGFVETTFRKNKFEEIEKGNWNLNSDQISALKFNLDYINSKGIPYLLVQAPITDRLYKTKENNKEIDSILSTYGKYKNYQNTIKLNDTLDFYDSNHMNQKAVEKFTNLLAMDVKRILKFRN